MTTTPVETFLKSLVPSPFDRATVAERKGAISEALKVHGLQAGYLFESGSWSHGTAVSGHSDVDYMAWATSARPSLPSTALGSLKVALAGAHWAIQDRRIASPTVKVEFYSEPNFEIVPAYMSRKVGEDYVFYIPGPADEWVESAPALHNRYVSEANDRLGKKVKPLARLLKAWKYHTGAPVSSFYLEMRTAQYANTQSSIYYHLDLRFLVDEIISHEMRSMNDPAGIVARINSTSSEEKRRTALALLRTAKANLDAAYESEGQDNWRYYSFMEEVFGPAFPYPTW